MNHNHQVFSWSIIFRRASGRVGSDSSPIPRLSGPGWDLNACKYLWNLSQATSNVSLNRGRDAKKLITRPNTIFRKANTSIGRWTGRLAGRKLWNKLILSVFSPPPEVNVFLREEWQVTSKTKLTMDILNSPTISFPQWVGKSRLSFLALTFPSKLASIWTRR